MRSAVGLNTNHSMAGPKLHYSLTLYIDKYTHTFIVKTQNQCVVKHIAKIKIQYNLINYHFIFKYVIRLCDGTNMW